jgi:hypothetical protein
LLVGERRCLVTHRARLERADMLGVAAVQLAQGQPLRQVAAQLGVARSTLRGWRAAKPLAGLPVELEACLATPAGARWLHQLVVVMHLIITLRAGAGVRLVCEFLELRACRRSSGPPMAASTR